MAWNSQFQISMFCFIYFFNDFVESTFLEGLLSYKFKGGLIITHLVKGLQYILHLIIPLILCYTW